MVESARVRQHKKKLRGVIDTSRRSRFKLNMHKRPEPTLSNGRQRIWVSQELRRHPGPEILMTAVPYPPRKQEVPILQPIGEEIRGTRLARPSILTTSRPWHGALQTRATRSRTRSTSSSRTSKSRSSNRNETNSSRSSSCSRDSSQRTGSRPRGNIVLEHRP